MTKVIIGKKDPANRRRPSTVGLKRFRDPDSGRLIVIRSIDANSATFGTDLHEVFARNVEKARKENKKKFGSSDRVSPKK